MQTAERQAARIRVRYLQAILKQDVSFFDTDVHTGEIVSSISSDTLHIQDAIGEKVTQFQSWGPIGMFSLVSDNRALQP